MLLVLGAIMRPEIATPDPTQIKMVKAVESARKEEEAEQGKIGIKVFLKHSSSERPRRVRGIEIFSSRISCYRL